MFFAAVALFALALACATAGAPSSFAPIYERALVPGEYNERNFVLYGNETDHLAPFVSKRDVDTAWSKTHPGMKEAIDAAVARTAGKTHYFWSGRVLPATSHEDGVMDRAMDIAKSKGGTTLELTLDGVNMPVPRGPDPDGKTIWQYASDEYAAASRGDVYFVKGESLRSGNVWEVYEYPRLKKSRTVKRIYQLLARRAKTEPPVQIWPEVKGCDGVFLLDRTVTCPAGAKLYHGSAKKPVVTAKTTVANDATIKVAAGGNAPGITRECVEIITGEFVTEAFAKAGVCDALVAKGNKGQAMTAVKKLLDSTKNRNYLQQQRIVKAAAKVVGTPILSALKKSLLDSLISISYYEKTQPETLAMAKEIDGLVTKASGKSPNLAAAWTAHTAGMKPAKTALLAELQKEIAQKAKQAKEAAARKDACGKPPSAPGSPSSPKPPSAPGSPKPPRMVRRNLSLFSPAPLSALERRVAKAPRSGAKAPAAPSCPLPGAKPKKVVPRDQLKEKPKPAKKPSVARTSPQAKPPAANKKTAKRPASRPRRQPGKAAPKKRITPKKQPRKVPRPAKKPKGTARPRRGRR
ncbi:hypothetical protein AURDEDRAFT_184229 [Auricularia subglabra TFB-10046 SS5]|nr:hypothetical protein AURDEDRAFT_184229 [Auricularia subglabra TFB-10046 SS5]